jgi:transposase-like protein
MKKITTSPGDPIRCPDGTWCLWGEDLPRLWGSSEQTILSEVSERVGSIDRARDLMAGGSARWEALPAGLRAMLTKRLKPQRVAPPAAAATPSPTRPAVVAEAPAPAPTPAPPPSSPRREVIVTEETIKRWERKKAEEAAQARAPRPRPTLKGDAQQRHAEGLAKSLETRRARAEEKKAAKEAAPPATGRARRITEEERARILELYAQEGATISGVAAALETSRRTVYKIIRDHHGARERRDPDAVAILAAYQETGSALAVCTRLKHNHRTVSKVLAAAGIDTSTPLKRRDKRGAAHHRALGAEEKRAALADSYEAAVATYLEGATVSGASSAHGVCRDPLRAMLRERGLLRGKGGAPPRTRLTTEEEDRVIALYETRTEGIRGIAAQFGHSPNTIRRVLRQRGVEINPRGGRPSNAPPRKPARDLCERDRQLAELIAEGKTRQEIAALIGMPYKSVCKAIVRIGLVVEEQRPREEGVPCT